MCTGVNYLLWKIVLSGISFQVKEIFLLCFQLFFIIKDFPLIVILNQMKSATT